MEMPKPGEAHARLQALVGTWSGEEKMHPSPWSPEGGVAEARTVSRTALEGFAVIADYEQRAGDVVTFQGHGVWTWDGQAGEYVLYWFDSMGTGAEVFRGTIEGDHIHMRSRNAMGHSRLTYDLSGDRRMSLKMEMSQDGEQWAVFMDGTYARQD